MRLTINDLQQKKNTVPIVMATAYDSWMARIIDEIVDSILVGDSLGMVVQGHETTLPVTLDEMIYHTRMVVRGSRHAFVICDMPFLSYQSSVRDAVISAGRCLKEGFAQAVKLEGGKSIVAQIEAITHSGIPVIGHLGLTPQSINIIGGYKKQAKSKADADLLLEDAIAIEAAGAGLLVLENIPHGLGKLVSESLSIPTIGIGAGPDCDGQVQVFHDLFGLNPDFLPRHATKFCESGTDMINATQKYANQVRTKKFISQ